MRYLNTTTLKQTTKANVNTILDSDPRVSNWFSNVPTGHKGEWVGDTYTFIEIPSLNADGSVNLQGFGLELLSKDSEDNYYDFYLPTGLPDTVKIDATNAQLAQDTINQEARDYLASTDWMVLREADDGTVMTAEIKQLRADARVKIV